MAYNITVIVYVVVQFAAFLLVLAGTPLDIFRGVAPEILGHRMVCITLFGMKVDCYNKTYLETTEELWAECLNRLNRFHAAQAFAIISILVYFAAFTFGLLLLFCCPCLRWVCLALNVAGILTLCVVWAAMVVTYYTDDSADCVKAKDEFTFGIGFDLLMTAWCLDIIAAILMLLAARPLDHTGVLVVEPVSARMRVRKLRPPLPTNALLPLVTPSPPAEASASVLEHDPEGAAPLGARRAVRPGACGADAAAGRLVLDDADVAAVPQGVGGPWLYARICRLVRGGFAAFLLVLAGTPLDIFRGVAPEILGHRMVCITLFGMKVDCYNKTYLETTEELWAECLNRLNRFHAAQAFAIISILVYFAAFTFGLLLLFCCPCLRWVCLALNVAGILTLCVVWAAMVVTYYTDDSADCVKAKDEFTFGIGFDLLMTAWCLDIIAAILMLLAARPLDHTGVLVVEPVSARMRVRKLRPPLPTNALLPFATPSPPAEASASVLEHDPEGAAPLGARRAVRPGACGADAAAGRLVLDDADVAAVPQGVGGPWLYARICRLVRGGFVAFLLVLVGTPLDMFRSKMETGYGTVKCITLWGVKENCASLDYDLTMYLFFSSCETRILRFRKSQRCAIISILVYMAGLIAGVVNLHGYTTLRWVCLALNIVGSVTLCVVWAAMAVTYNKNEDSRCTRLKALNYEFGVGFFLLVVAWILDIINIILLPLSFTYTYDKEHQMTELPTSEHASVLEHDPEGAAPLGARRAVRPGACGADAAAGRLVLDDADVAAVPQGVGGPWLYARICRLVRGGKKYNVSLVVYVVLQFFAFLFVLVGTPSDMFRERFRGGDPLCITLWEASASVLEHDPEGRPRWERGVPCAPVRVAPMQRQDGSSSTTRMWPPVTVLLYVILQFIAFLLVLVATPIDMFRLKKLYQYPHPNPCYTLWGAKFDCSSSTYSVKLSMMWSPCPSRRNLFRLAQVFAVISIFLYGAAFILGLIVLRCCPWLRWVCLVLNIAGMATLCIVWAAMVVTYYKDVPQRCMPLHFFVNYGAGFGLCLVAWCLDIINIGLLLLPLRVRDPGKIGKSVPSPRPGDEK
ncbi:Amastin surface glycofamily protein [Leishmania donovani]|uniref:Amastin surface glycofamily protein n=1 Tax=Leishmania donovani TaxID=5661 RepID=A0A504X1U4_LEIDO|nr:Amastin surface glycofamily protein [Leishmania donovani]